jgi:outer membrane protein assembly factor BamB
VRTFLFTISLVLFYGCGYDTRPDVIYQNGDFWADNFVNNNYPAKAFADDHIYCSSLINGGDAANQFYCLNLKTGKVAWAISVKSWASQPPIVCDSFIYYCSYLGDLYKFDKSGNQLWYLKFPHAYGGHCYNPNNKNLVVRTVTDGLREVDYHTGKVIDSIGCGGIHVPFPEFSGDTIYQLICDTLFCRQQNFSFIWKIKTGRNIDRIFKKYNRIYYIDDTQRMSCFNAQTGKIIWNSNAAFPKQPWGVHLEVEQGQLLCYFSDLNQIFIIDISNGTILQKTDIDLLQKKAFLLPNTKEYIVSNNQASYVIKVINTLVGAFDFRNQFDISVEKLHYR